MPFQLLSADDVRQMNVSWNTRWRDLFVKRVVDEFVSVHVDRAIERDLRVELLQAIKYAREPRDLWVSSGLCYNENHRFWIGRQSMTIKQLIYRTDALQRLAVEIGPQIKVSPLYQGGIIYLKIEFLPTCY